MDKRLQDAADFLQSHLKETPQVGVVLGSGLGDFVERIEDRQQIPYHEIPGFKECSVQGHRGQLVTGKIGETPVAAMQGRFHAYEGHDLFDVVLPVRVLGLLGTRQLFLTNAAGGLNPEYESGQLVMINDHINMTGRNPLIGPNDPDLGVRFPDMSYTYSPRLREKLESTAERLKLDLKSGVYAGVLGPSYETPAEVQMLKTLGADLVGMSTVPEAIAARHMGVELAGISCVTNLAAGLSAEELKHEDIKEVAQRVMKDFTTLLESTIAGGL